MQQTIEQLTALTADLYFTSETDAAWTAHLLDAAQPVAVQLIALSGRPAETTIEERVWADFSNRIAIIQDWMDEEGKATALRYQATVDYVNQHLTEVKVYRLGSIEIDIFVVGLNADCTPIALATKAVET
ncbi:MAG: hypothetical protein RI894_1740 [Bacteroidota bacterium]|jgi:hypothetical protein